MLRAIAESFQLSGPARRFQPLVIGGILVWAALANGQTRPPSGVESQSASQHIGDWRLVRTPDPRGGPAMVSIMRTADTGAADLGLAGLMVRCAPAGRQDWLLVVLEPFPARAKPQVTLGQPPMVLRAEATVAAPGTALLLPGEAGRWLKEKAGRNPEDLPVRIEFEGAVVRGSIKLGPVDEALALLASQCP